MSQVATHLNVNTPVDLGAPLQAVVPASMHGITTSIPANGSIESNLILSGGYQKLALSINSNKAFVVSVQRYFDPAGQIPRGEPVTDTIAAGAGGQATIDIADGLPYMSFDVSIDNSNVSDAATLSDIFILLQSQ